LLKSEGFKRVAFLSPQQPVYFLDPESQDLSMPRGLYDREPSRSEEMRILRDGPLSNRFLLPLKTETDLQMLQSGTGMFMPCGGWMLLCDQMTGSNQR
jgi:hypothetical protein